MLDRSDPLIGRSLDVFRQISQEALDAGARLQGLRRVFDQGAPQQHRCQMADLITEVQPVLANLTQVIKAQLQVDVATGLPDICADGLKIQRVLLALVRNAVDASANLLAERVIRIDVLADRYSIETGITDRGNGVSREVGEKLFHPFFTSKAAGHGLGLASSQAIVESHGGTMGFHNIPSSGVRFWFKLPVASD
jgi:signal transduction histidine kinase